MRNILLAIMALLIIGCKGENRLKAEENEAKLDSLENSRTTEVVDEIEGVQLTLDQANKLVELPLKCINVQYPNKLGQTLGSEKDLQSPKELHPAFYGCFDWHSSVHAHWSLVRLLKKFPKLDKAEEIRETLKASLSKENIQGELAYFRKEHNRDYERTYGWAWLLKLSQELNSWDSNLGKELSGNLQPLTDLIVERYTEFLPKLVYPIRVGEHTNTAFALSFAYDYAVASENEEFLKLIDKRSKEFYLSDNSCPIIWEPSGFDFLSPCLQQVDLMRKILPKAAFSLWIDDFMPQLKDPSFEMVPGEVSDRKDGKLVHLDGLNFSRAWVFYGLANQYPKDYAHLKRAANEHVSHSFPNLVGDSYEGGHWLGSFALYALEESGSQK
ncbi:DUF2891 domain-containing protein [Antarcticibacterium flavum]|uniref:DUF2891 domain-containing protein n=1 Tax=Antarcticibacterium flavum TaxID=2058175 RepID=A0A5B7X258_9FLAO|nr:MULTISPECIES: DUF2891 domain-containing protein [Antarcticibacterium]MCM4160215.1 DUF2891 domain-containing protein [Antarcticibacterium sp. W02-3]QCY68708.1 DUF2891 domain-containing protein [Antarcticibacterium flavum]